MKPLRIYPNVLGHDFLYMKLLISIERYQHHHRHLCNLEQQLPCIPNQMNVTHEITMWTSSQSLSLHQILHPQKSEFVTGAVIMPDTIPILFLFLTNYI